MKTLPLTLILLTLIMATLPSCRQGPGYPNTIASSHKKAPFWITESEILTKDYLCVIATTRSDMKTPEFAYKKARRQLHDILEKDAMFYLEPLKNAAGKSAYKKMVNDFVTSVSRKIMGDVRKQKKTYWRTEEVLINNQLKTKHHYALLLAVNRKKLHIAQQSFLLRRRWMETSGRKSLLEKGLTQSITRFDEHNKEKKPPSHKNTLTFP